MDDKMKQFLDAKNKRLQSVTRKDKTQKLKVN